MFSGALVAQAVPAPPPSAIAVLTKILAEQNIDQTIL